MCYGNLGFFLFLLGCLLWLNLVPPKYNNFQALSDEANIKYFFDIPELYSPTRQIIPSFVFAVDLLFLTTTGMNNNVNVKVTNDSLIVALTQCDKGQCVDEHYDTSASNLPDAVPNRQTVW